MGADLDVSSIDVGDNRDFKILTINNKSAKQAVCACDDQPEDLELFGLSRNSGSSFT